MPEQMTDPNMTSRIDGVGLREGVPVRDGWWDEYRWLSAWEWAGTAFVLNAEAVVGGTCPYYPAGGAG